jgi:hypothetical protein
VSFVIQKLKPLSILQGKNGKKQLRKLAPELLRMTAQDAIIYYYPVTGLISIPLMQTYCTCHTELNSNTTNCVCSNFGLNSLCVLTYII